MLEQHKNFYKALWGESTFYRSIWYGKKGEPPNRSKWFKSTSKALEFIEKISQTQIYNAYHACSLFDIASRKQIHVKETSALWLDIDLKDTPYNKISDLAKGYLPRFKDYCLGLRFWVIGTGNGIHVYWILEEPIENWKHHATALKSYCKEHDIIVDNARTCDSASIMRVPGSWNLKGKV